MRAGERACEWACECRARDYTFVKFHVSGYLIDTASGFQLWINEMLHFYSAIKHEVYGYGREDITTVQGMNIDF